MCFCAAFFVSKMRRCAFDQGYLLWLAGSNIFVDNASMSDVKLEGFHNVSLFNRCLTRVDHPHVQKNMVDEDEIIHISVV